MTGFPNLNVYLSNWAGSDAQRLAVLHTVSALADAGLKIAALIAKGPLAGQMAQVLGAHADGDSQKQLDFLTNQMVLEALTLSPVAFVGSEEDEAAITLNASAPLAVNIDPLDGSSNIDTNVSIGTIFSILPAAGPGSLLQPGTAQLAAGYIVYGPQTAMVLTVGAGTQIFWVDPETREWRLAKANVIIPPETREYAVNSSNFRHWDAPMQSYIADLKLGADGPRKVDFNMRWIGSLVADAFRILTRGGIYLYPGDARKGYRDGRLRLLYEGAPIAMIIEQAGGSCIDGTCRVMDVRATSLHQRTPLIFGSRNEVAEAGHYHTTPPAMGENSPLFVRRGLFRT
ncbi:MAG: class 1 fructose-bisphosphatase [Hyphomicrobiales bacterium]|nr:class 1 fructose-bisphosphatase [Hyphomicrobiales bacterium]